MATWLSKTSWFYHSAEFALWSRILMFRSESTARATTICDTTLSECSFRILCNGCFNCGACEGWACKTCQSDMLGVGTDWFFYGLHLYHVLQAQSCGRIGLPQNCIAITFLNHGVGLYKMQKTLFKAFCRELSECVWNTQPLLDFWFITASFCFWLFFSAILR